MEFLLAEPQGKPKNTEVGSLSLLQWIFPTQESNQGHPALQRILYQLSYEGSPYRSKAEGKKLAFGLTFSKQGEQTPAQPAPRAVGLPTDA